MDVAVSTTDLHADGSLMENTSSEMSQVARQANAFKLGGGNQNNSLESLLVRPNTPESPYQSAMTVYSCSGKKRICGRCKIFFKNT